MTDLPTSSVYIPPWRRRQQHQDDKKLELSIDSSCFEGKEKPEISDILSHETLYIKYPIEKLKELNEKEPSIIIKEIILHQCGFENLITFNLNKNSFVLLIDTFAKICSVTDNNEVVINLASNENFQNFFQTFVFDLAQSQYLGSNLEDFFKQAAIIFQTVIECVTQRTLEMFEKSLEACIVTTKSLSNDFKIKEIQEMFEKSKDNLEQHKLRLLTDDENDVVSDNDDVDANVEPSDDYRCLSIYPTQDEVLPEEEDFLSIHVHKTFQNVHQYLDVQFRLWKEDYVECLRTNICKYLETTESDVKPKPFNNFYKNVKFSCSRDHEKVLVKFRNVNNESYTNKYLRDGCIVCFSNDEFQSVLIGIIIDGSVKLQEKGQIVVKFEQDHEKIKEEEVYTMIECTIPFDPYYNVLKLLQNKDQTEFGMKRYIIDLNADVKNVPYLNDVNTLDVDSMSQLNLSQLKAFHAAVTKEFAIIQGPPGTGKTFLGTKIAKTFIMNKKNWYESSPILILCHSNRTLLQYQENLRNITHDAMYIGRKNLNSLRVKRKIFQKQISSNIKPKLDECSKAIRHYMNILEDIETNSVIIHFKEFFTIEKHLPTCLFSNATDEEMVSWLFGATTGDHSEENGFSKNTRNISLKRSKTHVLIRVSKIKNQIEDLKIKEDKAKFSQRLNLQMEMLRLEKQHHELQRRFEENQNIEIANISHRCNSENPYTINPDCRWQLYWYWLEQYKKYIKDKVVKLQAVFQSLKDKQNSLCSRIDLEIMKNMMVVVMTTNSALQHHTLLTNVKCPIVIVEEAAEIWESHVILSITSQCKQLILIGDYHQRIPTSFLFPTKEDLNINVSLFERMVRNKLPHHVLDVQYQMRPEIANLIVPTIYPKLENHSSVDDNPPILGIAKNLFFIDHKFEEEKFNTNTSNMHEVKFLLALARYLVQNGYRPHEITIVVAYTGQLITLKSEQKKYSDLAHVQVEVLSRYYGNNKIILLSLVRNNEEGQIGFLNHKSTITSALSRAREGLYMMGNMEMLRANEIWAKVNDVLVSQRSLGQSLVLRCQIHPDRETNVTLPEDFDNVTEGGCGKECGTTLLCGHICTMLCHIVDREHKNVCCKVCLDEKTVPSDESVQI
ncbi:hypothetical protein FQR65_LT14912 [Abscondita terminalis]|nr:hypothetical protein FQR65_LT14912 [Abscondita terminalis]